MSWDYHDGQGIRVAGNSRNGYYLEVTDVEDHRKTSRSYVENAAALREIAGICVMIAEELENECDISTIGKLCEPS